MRICHVNNACIQLDIGFAGHFQVVHQSAPDLRLPEEERAVPLYCVASTHTILHKYQWENCGTALSCSSPVLWVNKAGVYKCIVKDAEESMECCSREISVSGMCL